MADAIQVLSNTKNDLIVAAVQKNLIEKAVIAPTVSNLSGFAIKGAKSFKVPKLTNFTVVDRAFGSAGDATALTDSHDTINLDFNAYVAYLYDSRDAYQSSIEYQVEAALRASAAHAKYVDQQVIAGLISAADVEVSVASFTTVKEQALELRRQILQNGGDLGKVTLAISLDKEAEMLKEADFIRQDYIGSANVRLGQIGQIYGMPVVISRLLTGEGANSMLCYDADGFGLAFQGGVEMSEQMANEYGANSKRVAIDQVFGCGGLQLVAGVSPLVGKLVA
jgi:hypothetical protein